MRPAAPGRWLGSRLARPEVQTDLAQIVKATLATVGAWLLAEQWLELHQAYLAPWAALLTIHATVYRTFWRGSQAVLATVLGILVSFAATQLLGYGALALGLAVGVGLAVSRVRPIREEGIAVATTALFVIAAGYATSRQDMLVDRFLDTLLGVVVGVVVNVLLVPPLDDRVAEQALDRATTELGNLLLRMSRELSADLGTELPREWIEETRRIDDALDGAQDQLSFSQESQWLNLRRTRSTRASDVGRETELLVRLEEGVAQARTMARVVDKSVVRATTWEEDFREGWVTLLHSLGTRVADPDLEVESPPPADRRPGTRALPRGPADAALAGLRRAHHGRRQPDPRGGRRRLTPGGAAPGVTPGMRTARGRIPSPLPTYSAPGGLRQGPGRAPESPARPCPTRKARRR